MPFGKEFKANTLTTGPHKNWNKQTKKKKPRKTCTTNEILSVQWRGRAIPQN